MGRIIILSYWKLLLNGTLILHRRCSEIIDSQPFNHHIKTAEQLSSTGLRGGCYGCCNTRAPGGPRGRRQGGSADHTPCTLYTERFRSRIPAATADITHMRAPFASIERRPGTGRGRSPPRPLLAVPNVTANPSTASVPTSYYSTQHYNCLCTLKGLEESR